MKLKKIALYVFAITGILLFLNVFILNRNIKPIHEKDDHFHTFIKSNEEEEEKQQKETQNIHTPPIPRDGDFQNPNVKLPFLGQRNTSILVLTYNRPESLKKTLKRLYELRGFNEIKNVIISQDGSEPSVSKFIKLFVKKNIEIIHYQRTNRNDKLSKVANIARHYKYALDKAFEISEFVIVMEDDCVPSPDILTFFDQLGHFLIQPYEKVWCISSWNDFGFPDSLHLNSSQVFRTQFFPGLGWMMHKTRWKKISPFFPPTGWDYFFRTSFIHEHEDCLVPYVSRTSNIGDKGSTVHNKHTYDSLLKNIVSSNEEYVKIDTKELEIERYESDIQNKIKNSKILKKNSQWKNSLIEKNYNVYVIPYEYIHLKDILRSLKITYHVEERAHHNKLIKLFINKDITLLLINCKSSKYIHLLPENVRMRPIDTFEIVKGKRNKQSCDEICNSKQKKCRRDHFDYIMSCDILNKYFQCEKGCQVEIGSEIPVYVNDKRNRNHQMCVISWSPIQPSCEATHKSTTRLCPCV